MVTNAKVNTNITKIKVKIPDSSGLVIKFVINTKTMEIGNKVPDTTGFITTPEFNKLEKTYSDARIKEATKSLVNSCDIMRFLLIKSILLMMDQNAI